MAAVESVADAVRVLVAVGAPPRLTTHGQLVAEAADALLAAMRGINAPVDEAWVRAGAVLHDAGKSLFVNELDGPGSEHEPAGEQLLLRHGVPAHVARCCRSHAQWKSMPCALEELLVALADKLWKGVRVADLEERVVVEAARATARGRWDIFVTLDSAFEAIADGATDRLARSR